VKFRVLLVLVLEPGIDTMRSGSHAARLMNSDNPRLGHSIHIQSGSVRIQLLTRRMPFSGYTHHFVPQALLPIETWSGKACASPSSESNSTIAYRIK
jgi:hypothetical protein